jgi:hypothetical protein
MQIILWLDQWLALIHPVLESLFFLATLAIAWFAYRGLEQLRIAKDTARISARREAFKLAAEECRTFADRVIPLTWDIVGQVNGLQLVSFANPTFTVTKGDFTNHNFSDKQIEADLRKVNVIPAINSLEGFAIFFASGIAEESIGYRETGRAFCDLTAKLMPAIYLLRKQGQARYHCTLELYELWLNKLNSEALTKTEASLATSLANIQSARTRIQTPPIRTIGDE